MSNTQKYETHTISEKALKSHHDSPHTIRSIPHTSNENKLQIKEKFQCDGRKEERKETTKSLD